jgi:hypothetical protein
MNIITFFFDACSMKTLPMTTLLMFGLLLVAEPALAYVGPGLGAGALASVLGVLVGVLMLVVGVVWYPAKRLIKYLRSKK